LKVQIPVNLQQPWTIFDNCVFLNPVSYNDKIVRPELEERLEDIINGAALLADSECTRDERRERIVTECSALRNALQDLLSEYMSNQVRGPS